MNELQQIATMYGFLNKGILIEEVSAVPCRKNVQIVLRSYFLTWKICGPDGKEFSAETYKIFPENNIRIYKPQRPAEVYSKLASENDIYITGMKTIQTSLEDYYMELKKRGGVQ